MFREPAGLLFGIDHLAVLDHIKDAATGFDELHLDPRKGIFQRGLQTEGPGFVISNHTIFDSDSHVSPHWFAVNSEDSPDSEVADPPVQNGRLRE